MHAWMEARTLMLRLDVHSQFLRLLPVLLVWHRQWLALPEHDTLTLIVEPTFFLYWLAATHGYAQKSLALLQADMLAHNLGFSRLLSLRFLFRVFRTVSSS